MDRLTACTVSPADYQAGHKHGPGRPLGSRKAPPKEYDPDDEIDAYDMAARIERFTLPTLTDQWLRTTPGTAESRAALEMILAGGEA